MQTKKNPNTTGFPCWPGAAVMWHAVSTPQLGNKENLLCLGSFLFAFYKLAQLCVAAFCWLQGCPADAQGYLKRPGRERSQLCFCPSYHRSAEDFCGRGLKT